MSTLSLKRGDPLIRDFYWVHLDQAGVPDLTNPIDLTDHVARMQVRDKNDEIYASIASDGDNPKITIDVDTGKVTVHLVPTVTQLFPLEILYFDIEFFLDSVSIGSTPTMTIHVEKDITRWPAQL
jgi:hypothetical protein